MAKENELFIHGAPGAYGEVATLHVGDLTLEFELAHQEDANHPHMIHPEQIRVTAELTNGCRYCGGGEVMAGVPMVDLVRLLEAGGYEVKRRV